MDEYDAPPEGGPLELDPTWVAEREAKAKAARPPRRTAATVIAVLVVALVAAGVVVIYRREAAPPRPHGPGVAIRVTAIGGAEITIDGVPAGKAPLQILRPKSTTPIIIAAPKLGATKQVVPDHDQTVDLTAP